MKIINKILVLFLCLFVTSTTVFAESLKETIPDDVSMTEDDIQKAKEGIDSFSSFFLKDNPSDQTNSGAMQVKQLSGEIIKLHHTKTDVIYDLVMGEDLYENIVSEYYESLTESNQLVILEMIEGEMQVGSISELSNSEWGFILSVDVESVKTYAETKNIDFSNITYYKSGLFQISIVEFMGRDEYMVFYDEEIIGEIPVNVGVIYSKEALQEIFKPLIEENISYFTEAPENAEIEYGGISYFKGSSNNQIQNSNTRKLSTFTIILISFAATSMIYGIYLSFKKHYRK